MRSLQVEVTLVMGHDTWSPMRATRRTGQVAEAIGARRGEATSDLCAESAADSRYAPRASE